MVEQAGFTGQAQAVEAREDEENERAEACEKRLQGVLPE
jgi:hypothetical protein